jgi:hypothetical protein
LQASEQVKAKALAVAVEYESARSAAEDFPVLPERSDF